MIKILIAEDQSMVLGALSALLDMEDDFEVVEKAKNGKDALAKSQQQPIDIILTDIEMPCMTGIELAQELQKKNHPAKVMILTTFARGGYLRRAMAAGVKGYLLKDAPSDSLADAVRKIHAGKVIVAPELVTEAWAAEDPLGDNERKILRFSLEGHSTKEIAELICLSAGTVRNYLSEVTSKLGAKNRIEAARIAKQKGWL
ncbi:MAG: two-component system response regulator DesR [Colwellia sp.]|jgi:two-component system response regulator DesR|uniref:response regulator transcription factor n=1 Tax=unclassified Colwellia TaxID=196834 RepID=UPI0015F70837|nr:MULTISPECIES: response regulator transcription factor [unclassified Colwellia]MBA6232493.1 response regulator transcription factor [Colwellia sp. MB02u-7]MBA6237670.1 response regulator transcription factor [Colwellia sp. MB02u-11]MBA6252012.1 response regulator transcription factor [Colwellia sp. MB3u-55]MBA6255387.1 response regulator transcription factor [Colwellia sp. MB3u-28]MBA6261527.1 response regulator transcription factor [Colwellia sp. MB3u-41]